MNNELRNKIEAILFASGKGVSESELVLYCEVKEKEIRKTLHTLQEEYSLKDSSLSISEHNGKWKLTVRSKYIPYVQKLVSETEFPAPILKTLAVIAYKSPVLQSDIITMRGQGAYEHIKDLVKEKFVTKEEHGRSYILKITDKFYEYFDVEGDEEIREVFTKLREQQQKIGNLTVIDDEDISTTQKDSQQKLGTLEVVQSKPIDEKDHNAIFEEKEQIKPVVKHKSNEEKESEEQFLKSMDERLAHVSDQVSKHTFPERTSSQKEEKEEPSDPPEQRIEEQEDINPLETLEQFASKGKQKKEDEEEYI